MAGELDRKFRPASRIDLRTEKPDRQLDRFRRGEVLTAAKLSRVVDAANRQTSLGPVQQTNGLRERVTGIYEARVLQELDDFLICLLFEYSDNPERIVVAKPFGLRRNPHETTGRGAVTFVYDDAVRGKRTATFVDQTSGDTIAETHYISPAYLPTSSTYAGDVLYVTNAIVGGLAVFEGTFELDGNREAPEHWLDVNIDGRAWAAEVPCEPAIELATEPQAIVT